MNADERIATLERLIIKQDERIAKLENALGALEQKNEACHRALGKLTATCQEVIDEMKPALVNLSLRGTAWTEYMENDMSLALTAEQANEMREQYHRASRRVEHAFTRTTHLTQGFQL
jgi:hypothetical protein